MLDNFALNHSLYTLVGSGTITSGGPGKLNCEAKLLSGVTSSIGAKIPALKYALNQDGSLSVPVIIMKSSADSPWVVLPDVKKLGEKILKGGGRELIKNQGGKLLEKVSPGLGSKLKSLF